MSACGEAAHGDGVRPDMISRGILTDMRDQARQLQQACGIAVGHDAVPQNEHMIALREEFQGDRISLTVGSEEIGAAGHHNDRRTGFIVLRAEIGAGLVQVGIDMTGRLWFLQARIDFCKRDFTENHVIAPLSCAPYCAGRRAARRPRACHRAFYPWQGPAPASRAVP